VSVRRPRPGPPPRQHGRRPANAARRDSPLELERFVPYRIATLANLLALGASRLYARRFGLLIREWRVLAVLGEGRPLSAVELSRRTAIDTAPVHRAVASLVRRALVAREADAFDARRSVLRLTRKGRATYRRIVPLAIARERELLAALTPPERRELGRLLAKLHARAEAMLARSGGTGEEGEGAD
jgi:DNA-binding MarR family transcriptional regulator